MTTITFIVGIERFNAAVWTDVEQALSKAGLRVELRRYHDAHVDEGSEALGCGLHQSHQFTFTSRLARSASRDFVREGRFRLREHA
jgi:hypothetical protein